MYIVFVVCFQTFAVAKVMLFFGICKYYCIF